VGRRRVVDVFGLARARKTTMASARRLTTDRIWRVLEKTAFAVISFFPHLRRGVSLRDMAKPAAAIARVPVS
jgi:hypothetical protein